MTSTAARVVALLRARGQTVALAESLTGGLVAAALTDVPGSSQVLVGGVVAYTVPVKTGVVGVPPAVLAEHGVVSRECAEALAAGARRLLRADWGVGTTGVAGPGPSDGTPAGTVHVAVTGQAAGESVGASRLFSLDGDRHAVRRGTVEAALRLLQDTLLSVVSEAEGTVEVSSHDETDGAEEVDHGPATT